MPGLNPLRRARLFALLLLGWATVLRAEEVEQVLARARAAESKFDCKAALELYLQADAARPNDSVVLQKISQQYSDSTNDTNDTEEKKRLCTQALAYAKRATELNPKNAVNLLSLAICYGKLGLYSDTRTKIEYSRLVKEFTEQALAVNPDYDYAHHVLGRWNYEVASLGAGTRFIVRLIYGGLPPASTAEGVRQLQRAVEISPQLPAHRVELGFALLADGQRDAARVTFEQALAMKPVEKYDTEGFRRAREALAGLK
ncbi:MAG: hypothetical protein JWM32_119 [Verrucomicrobia bacterium]|nr:hypothetical protein [Verrucomicrobiota bacterium]